MARPRLPTETLELRGAFIKNPQRRPKAAAKHKSGLGLPPASLSVEQKSAWREIVRCAIPGVLTKADRLVVENLSGLLVMLRAGTITPPDRSQFLRCLSALGMTPVDRTKLTGQPDKAAPKSGWDALDGPPPPLKVVRGGKKG